MGHCGEFGCSIGGGCTHPMDVRDAASCACAACGVVCRGRFQGCASVWSLGTTKLPTAADRDIDFIALPYLGVDGPPVRTGPVEPADPGEPSGSHSPPGPGTEQSLQDAVALQQAVNQELMEAVRKLEATVAELTAAPPTLEAPGAPSSLRPSRERRGHAVDVLQWVEAGARPAQPPERPAAGDPRLRPGRPALRRSPRRRTHRP